MIKHSKTSWLCLASLCLLVAGAPAAAANFTTGSSQALRFGVHELTFTGNGGVADPFATTATVTFTPPSGMAVTTEMFWDGSNTWRARAYVTETGMWKWSSNAASDPGLDRKSGEFIAGPSDLRGKLKPHPSNPRALVTDNGQWFAPIGDTAYYMFDSKNCQDYVRDDWNHGVNFLRCSAFGHLRDFNAHFTMQNPDGIPVLASLQSDDAQLKWMLENYPGMFLQYIMLPENPAVGWSKVSVTAKNQLLQQMVARYAAFPTLTWQIMNDSFYQKKDAGNVAIAHGIGAFLVAHDVYGHLRSTGARRSQGAPFADSAWTSFLHFETKDALAADEADSNAPSNKFTWCGEDRYETYIPPIHKSYFFRRLMWAWLLSGGSACYGGDWDATIPYERTGFSGLDSVQFIKGYFESRHIDLGKFIYQDRLAADPLATGKDRPQSCNNGTSEYIIYHPNAAGAGADANVHASRTAAFSIDLCAASGVFQIEWFRCLDGVTAQGGTVDGGAVRTLTAPWPAQDVVCRLTAGIRNTGGNPLQRRSNATRKRDGIHALSGMQNNFSDTADIPLEKKPEQNSGI
jgi:hypothetical protein